MKISDLTSSEYNPYYGTYINLNNDESLIEGLKSGLKDVIAFFKAIPSDKLLYRYAEGKWTIQEILQHIIDTERIFAYRALRFAREDKTPLMGFDQDAFVEPSHANSRNIDELLAEYMSLRESTIHLFKGLPDDMLKIVGEASNSPMSARATGFVIIGHERHHCNVIRELYL